MSLWWCVLCILHASAVLAATASFDDVFDDSVLDGDLEKISGFWYQIAELHISDYNTILCRDIILEGNHIIHVDKICEETGNYQIARTENGNFVIHEAGNVINLKATKDLSFLGLYKESTFNSADYIKIYGRTQDKTHHFSQITKHLSEYRVVTCAQKTIGNCLPNTKKQITQYTNQETSNYHIQKILRTQREPRSLENEKTSKKEGTEINDYAIQKINGTDYIVYDDIFIPLESGDNKEGDNRQDKTDNASPLSNPTTKDIGGNIEAAQAKHVDGKELADDPNNPPLNHTNSSIAEINKLNTSVNVVENLVLINTLNNVTHGLTPSANVTNIPNEEYNQMFSNTTLNSFDNSLISKNNLRPNINISTNYDASNVTTENKASTIDQAAEITLKEVTASNLNGNASNVTMPKNRETNDVSSARTNSFNRNNDIGNENVTSSFTSTVANSIIYTNIVTPYPKISDSELNNFSSHTPSYNFSADRYTVSYSNIITPHQSSYGDLTNNSTAIQETDYNYTNYIQENETKSTAYSSLQDEFKWINSSNESLLSETNTFSFSTTYLTYTTENSGQMNLTRSDGIDEFWKSNSTLDSSTTDSDTSSHAKNVTYLSSFSSINFTKIFTPLPNPLNISTEHTFQNNTNTPSTINHQLNVTNTTQSSFAPLGDTTPLFTFSDHSNESVTHKNTTSISPTTTEIVFTITVESNITANMTPMMNTQTSNQSSTENPFFSAQDITLHVTNTTENVTSPQNLNTTTTTDIPVTSLNSTKVPVIANITTHPAKYNYTLVKPNTTNISTIKPGNSKSSSSIPNSTAGIYLILVLLILNFLLAR